MFTLSHQSRRSSNMISWIKHGGCIEGNLHKGRPREDTEDNHRQAKAGAQRRNQGADEPDFGLPASRTARK